jgi:preprotein translocase subunit SecG
VTVIVLVLLQHGKGADMGAAFGSGSSGSLFGSSGSANFLSRTTGALAAVFFITSLGLTYLSTNKTESGGVMEKAVQGQSKRAEPPPSPSAEDGTSKATEIPK